MTKTGIRQIYEQTFAQKNPNNPKTVSVEKCSLLTWEILHILSNPFIVSIKEYQMFPVEHSDKLQQSLETEDGMIHGRMSLLRN